MAQGLSHKLVYNKLYYCSLDTVVRIIYVVVTEQNCLRTTLRVLIYILPILYCLSWFLLIVATIDAGLEVQSGALGWISVLARKKPKFPELPTSGLYRIIRHPIYASFFLAVLTVPTWTADQIVVSLILGGYCIFAPILKDRRLIERHGEKYLRYKNTTPYMLPSKRIK